MDKKYHEQSTLYELLNEPKAAEFMDKMAPGMRSGPIMQHIGSSTVQRLKEGMAEKAPLFQALIDLANGDPVSVKIEDPSVTHPQIQATGELTYNIDDVDGQMYMLEHRFSGCLVLRFTKEMDETVYGTVFCGEKKLEQGLLAHIQGAGNIQMLGIPVRKVLKEYNTVYVIRVEGFRDTYGNEMKPQEICVKTLPKPERDLNYQEHDAVALEVAREGIVLLKNDQSVLPLHPESSLRIEGVENFRLSAVGAGKLNPRYYMNLKRALEECSSFREDPDSDIGMIVISRASGENYDNNAVLGEFYLSGEEETMLQKMTSECSTVIAIINSGYPMDLRWVEKYQISAVLWCGFPGMLGGQAVVEILDGRVNPSGKLPDTWSLDYKDIPSSANFYLPEVPEEGLGAEAPVFVDTCYEEDIYVGYRYFETFQKPVMYPFGHGLSYTYFEIAAQYQDGQVEAKITNKGDIPGKETLQIYVRIPDGKLEQPSLRLIGFRKTELLKKGDTQTIVFLPDEQNLASFDTEHAVWIMEPGVYEYYAGTSVGNLWKCGEECLEQEKVLSRSENLMKLPIEMDCLSKYKNNYPKGERSGIKEQYTELTPKTRRKQYDTKSVEIDDDTNKLSIYELARLSVCASHEWGMHETGVAGRMYRIDDEKIPDYAVSDGNNGVNVNRPNIGMPASNTLCATWNPKLAWEAGRVIAEEAKENHVSMILAPAMNIHRNPLNGRHPEYFSEDPLLGGIMAGHQCKGLEENGVHSSMKHIVANNCEASRKRNHSFVSERALRELYLKVFQIAMSIQQPASVMTGYNACNGCFAAEDEEMIQGIFHREFGFKGFVMTDWGSYDTVDVVKAVQAGNCWMTPGTQDDTYVTPIVVGVRDGKITEARLRENVQRILNCITKI